MKTNLLRLFLIFHFSFLIFNSSQAQFAFIPDTNFRNFLMSNGFAGCMQGDSLDTTCTTVLSTGFLNISNQNIYDLTGIQYFDFLNTLYCSSNHLTSLPLLPSNTRMIDCSYNNLSSLPDFSNLTWPLYFDCSYNNLTYIGPPFPSAFEVLNCRNNNLTSLPYIPFSINGGGLYCDNNNIATIAGISPYLIYFTCSHNNLNTFPLFPGMGFFDEFDCSYNNLSAFPDFQFLPDSLSYLNIRDNPIDCLPAIKTGTLVWTNTNISCLPATGIIFSASPLINNLPLCSIASDCPGFWNISGYVFFDADSNCTQDSGEIRLTGIPVVLESNGMVQQQFLTDSLGQYSFRAGLGNYIIRIDTINASFRVVCPVTFSVSSALTSNDSIDIDINFGLVCNPGFDLTTRSISPIQMFRPGFHTTINLDAGDGMSFSGISCANGLSGFVRAILDNLVSYVSPAPGAIVPSSVIGDTITWNIADFSLVDPLHDFNIIVEVSTSATINDTICIELNVGPVAGDNIPLNNTLTECLPVVGSFDPNEKYMSPSGLIDASQQWFTFTIFFQNVGNASAEDIYILDTLDQNLDATTFTYLSSSHEVITQLLPGNILRFNYPDIYLADSITDEPGSHGYVKFKIKRNQNLPINTTISNTAHIFFDFNAAVATNTTSATLTTSVGISENVSRDINIYPNPARNQLTIDSRSAEGRIRPGGQYTISSIEILNTMGQQVYFVNAVERKRKTIDVADFDNGIYFVKIFLDDGKISSLRKFVKQ